MLTLVNTVSASSDGHEKVLSLIVKQRLLIRPRDGSGQTRLGSGWAGLLGGLGHENYRALARRSRLARSV